MYIGVYSIKIDSISSNLLEIENNRPDVQYYQEEEEIIFEVRQVVFHVLKFPVFPITKIYVEKGDRNNVSEDIKRQMKEKLNPKTPWYSYIGGFIGIGAVWYLHDK